MGSPGAIVLGIACVVCTLILLFGHIRTTDDLTIVHLYIMLALIVTLGAGHFMWDAFSAGPAGIARGLSLTLLFVVGTVVCVGLSGGRSASILEARERQEANSNQERIAQQKLVDAANAAMIQTQSLYDAADSTATEDERIAAQDCASGMGSQCKGKTSTATTSRNRASAIKQDLEQAKQWHRDQLLKLNAMHAPEPANQELKQVARLYGFFVRKDDAAALADVKLLFPYALALLAEFGTIIFFNIGFAARPHKPAPQASPEPTPAPRGPTVSIATIASELAIKPHIARRHLRDLNIAKPAQGWMWPQSEADDIKAKIATVRASGTLN